MKNVRLAAALLVAAALPAAAQTDAEPPRSLLLTRQGWDAGVQASRYKYEEPNLPQNALNGGAVSQVDLTGNRGGVVGAYNFTNPEHWFTRIDARISYGSLKYVGSGTQYGVKDWIAEGRVVSGKDLLLGGSVSLSPYAGLGYRYLYDDSRGTSTLNGVDYNGYRRYSNYLYAPVGVTMRFSGGERWVISPTVEYDAFIQGKQVSKLSDAVSGGPSVTNDQSDGYGYRAYLMLETERWTFGPWLHYWSIKDSNVVPISSTVGIMEPANWTREYGLEFRYRF